jgi:hypothetical protein
MNYPAGAVRLASWNRHTADGVCCGADPNLEVASVMAVRPLTAALTLMQGMPNGKFVVFMNPALLSSGILEVSQLLSTGFMLNAIRDHGIYV